MLLMLLHDTWKPFFHAANLTPSHVSSKRPVQESLFCWSLLNTYHISGLPQRSPSTRDSRENFHALTSCKYDWLRVRPRAFRTNSATHAGKINGRWLLCLWRRRLSAASARAKSQDIGGRRRDAALAADTTHVCFSLPREIHVFSPFRRREAYCTVCEKFFTGDLVDHRRSDTHKVWIRHHQTACVVVMKTR